MTLRDRLWCTYVLKLGCRYNVLYRIVGYFQTYVCVIYVLTD